MPQFERRLYDPAEDPQLADADDSFDDEGSRLPLLIVIALVVLASFGGVVWLAYTQGVQRGREDAPRIVAEQQPSAAPNKNPYSKLQIYQPKGAADTGAETGSVAKPPSENIKPHAPAVAALKRPAPSSHTPAAGVPFVTQSPKPAAKAPVSQAPANAGKVLHPVASPEKPPSKTRAQPSLPHPTRLQTSVPAQNAPADAPGAAAAGPGDYVLQIGSYSSEAEANASWQTYRKAHASVAPYGSDVKAADLGQRGTWYRLRIGPFGTLAEASAACARLKAQGASCFPAKR